MSVTKPTTQQSWCRFPDCIHHPKPAPAPAPKRRQRAKVTTGADVLAALQTQGAGK